MRPYSYTPLLRLARIKLPASFTPIHGARNGRDQLCYPTKLSDESDQTPHFRHDRGRNRRRLCGARGEKTVDLGRIGQKVAHLFRDWRELRHSKIGKCVLENRNLRAGELFDDLFRRMVRKRRVDVDQVLRFWPASQAFELVGERMRVGSRLAD